MYYVNAFYIFLQKTFKTFRAAFSNIGYNKDNNKRGLSHIRTLVKASVSIWDTDKKPSWSDKAGGYGVQDPFGMVHIKRINGDYYNVVGLPISRLYRELLKASK